MCRAQVSARIVFVGYVFRESFSYNALHSAGKFVATEINTLLNASESLLSPSLTLSLSLPHSLSHSHLSSPSDLLTCADKLSG